MAEVNSKNVGKVYCFNSQTDSHFMTAKTTIEAYHNLFTPAIRLKRRKLGVGADSAAGVFGDKFTGNSAASGGEDQLREQWEKR